MTADPKIEVGGGDRRECHTHGVWWRGDDGCPVCFALSVPDPDLFAGFLPKACAEVEAVLRFGQAKHGNAWEERSTSVDAFHAFQHLLNGLREMHPPVDEETQRHHLAHAICRIAFILERSLQTAKVGE